MTEIACLIALVLRGPTTSGSRREVRESAAQLCSKFTPYPDLP